MPMWFYSDGKVSRAFLDQATSTATQSTCTFTSLSFGTADTTRYLLAAIQWQGAAGALTVSSCTIGGSAATQIGSTVTDTGNRSVALFLLQVPTGTTGTVSFVLSGNSSRSSVALYSLLGLLTAAATSTATSTALAPTATLAVPAGSAVVGLCSTGAGSSPTASWSGLTEDTDSNFGGNNQCRSSASAEFTASGSQSVTCTFSAAGASCGIFAVFAPP